MSGTETEQQRAAATATAEVSDFATLLDREFKPKTDRAREAVANAVQTLARAGIVAHDADFDRLRCAASRRSSRRSTAS